MKRHLLNLLTLLSLAGCVAVAALWVRSHYGGENIIWPVRVRSDDWRHWEMTDAGVALRPGVLLIGRVSEWAGSAAEAPPAWRRSRLRYNGSGTMAVVQVAPSRLGFGRSRGSSPPSASPQRYGRRVWLVCVPWWSLLLAASVPTLYRLLPALYQHAHLAAELARARRAAHQGLCLDCGYDLRATADRCPECWTEVPRPRATLKRWAAAERLYRGRFHFPAR
jgi:hypothetical protein